jgi:hypothetical protein
MGKARVGIAYPGFDAKRLDNVVDRSRGHLPVPVTQGGFAVPMRSGRGIRRQ